MTYMNNKENFHTMIKELRKIDSNRYRATANTSFLYCIVQPTNCDFDFLKQLQTCINATNCPYRTEIFLNDDLKCYRDVEDNSFIYDDLFYLLDDLHLPYSSIKQIMIFFDDDIFDERYATIRFVVTC